MKNKYINADKLIAEIKRLAKVYQDATWRTVKGETAKDFRDKLLAFIDSLQQEQNHDDSIRTKIVNRAKFEKQVVIITESDGNAEIVWDTRSLEDTKDLLEYGLAFISGQLGKQKEQKPIRQ